MRAFSTLGLTAWLLMAAGAGAADWPQWRGPKRDGHSPETGLLKAWPAAGPKLLWTSNIVGTGYSTPAVVGGVIYIIGTRDGEEYVIALDDMGKEKWATRIGPVYTFKTNTWTDGPNATPTVDADAVYALGSQGILVCVERKTGKEVWRKDFPKDLDAVIGNIGGSPEKMGWGYSWSPLLDGQNLICVPGGPKGLLAALNCKTGAVVWRIEKVTAESNYSSPIGIEIDGTRQYVQVTQKGLVGIDTKGGLLWEYKRRNPWPDVVCDTPILQGDLLYTTEWGGAELIRLNGGAKPKATKVNSNKEIGNRHGGVVLVDGFVFGYHEEQGWRCQDFKTGAIKWKAPRGRAGLPMGSTSYADGRVYCFCDGPGAGAPGIAALLDPTPEKYKVIARFNLPQASDKRKLRGGVWTPPVIADGRLYLRDQELLFCYEIK